MDSTSNDMSAIIEAGRQGLEAKDRVTEWEGLPLVADGVKMRLADELLREYDRRQDTPARRSGSFTFVELASFIEFVNRYKVNDESLVFVIPAQFSMSAVFNSDPAGPDPEKAGWRDHVAHYVCPRSPEWKYWTELDGVPMSQEKFADVIDERMEDLTTGDGYPMPVDVLEMARNLMVRVGSTYQRSINPTTGEGTLVSKTENGSDMTKIPRAIGLGLRVFDGGARYAVEGRIRFALVQGKPAFTVLLHRRSEIERDAFADVRNAVAKETGLPVLAGAL